MGRIPPLELVEGKDREYAYKMAGQKKADPSAKTSDITVEQKQSANRKLKVSHAEEAYLYVMTHVNALKAFRQ